MSGTGKKGAFGIRTSVDSAGTLKSERNGTESGMFRRNAQLRTKGQNWIEFYPDAEDDIPPNMLEPMGQEASITV